MSTHALATHDIRELEDLTVQMHATQVGTNVPNEVYRQTVLAKGGGQVGGVVLSVRALERKEAAFERDEPHHAIGGDCAGGRWARGPVSAAGGQERDGDGRQE